MRSGEICNACVLLVKRWKKLPVGTKKNWNHVSCCFSVFLLFVAHNERLRIQNMLFVQVVDARGGPSLKLTSRPKKIKSISKKARPNQISRLQKELKRNSQFCFACRSYSVDLIDRRMMSFLCFARFRRPQHDLQRLSCSVPQLQQPVRRRVGHRAEPRVQPLPGFLLSGSNLLEEVRLGGRTRPLFMI